MFNKLQHIILLSAILFTLLLLPSSAVKAAAFNVDMDHSTIGFSVKHMVISKVHGNFTDYKVELNYDAGKIENSTVSAIIKTAGINTSNEKRDEHLRSADFFDAEKYPSITFKSTKVKKIKEGYALIGHLSIKGVTKTVTIPFNLLGVVNDPWGNTRAGFEGHLTINRQDYNLTWNKALETGGLIVSDEVSIELNIEAIKSR